MSDEAQGEAVSMSFPVRCGSPILVQRVPRWRIRLIELLVDLQNRSRVIELPFSWNPEEGDNCMTLCSKGVDAVLGVDIHAEFISDGSYTDMPSAYRKLRSRGFRSVEQLLGSMFPEKPVLQALPGDLVVVPAFDNPTQPDQIIMAGAIVDPPYFWCMIPTGLGRGLLTSVIDSVAFTVGNTDPALVMPIGDDN